MPAIVDSLFMLEAALMIGHHLAVEKHDDALKRIPSRGPPRGACRNVGRSAAACRRPPGAAGPKRVAPHFFMLPKSFVFLRHL
jgi:hypothetical protein